MDFTTLVISAVLIATAYYFLPKKIYDRTEFVLFLVALFLVLLGFIQPTILLFLAVLFVLILVHEWGHFIVAKKTGMRVDEFGIGFPPKLFGIKKGETEYTFNALPIGGFVRILGENMDENKTSLSEQDKARTFSSRSKWAQSAVLIAGVTMNVIFAWFLFTIIFVAGVPKSIDENLAGEDAQLVVSEVLPDGPAANSGMTRGSIIVAIQAGEKILSNPTPTSFAAFTQENENVPLFITYLDGDTKEKVEVVPETGLLVDKPEQVAIGVALAMVETVQQPLHVAMFEALKLTGRSLVAITVGLGGLITGAFTGEADLSQVTGPVGIVGLVGDAAEFGWTSLLMFTAIISLNLAVINLLPFPALDGGRLVMVAIEAVIRRPINPTWVANVNLVGFVLLITLMVAVTYSDVTKLL